MAVEESYAALARELVLEFFVVQERVVGESAGVFFLRKMRIILRYASRRRGSLVIVLYLRLLPVL